MSNVNATSDKLGQGWCHDILGSELVREAGPVQLTAGGQREGRGVEGLQPCQTDPIRESHFEPYL